MQGHVQEVTETTELDELRKTPLVAWASGAKEHYVRINPVELADVESTLPTCPRTGGLAQLIATYSFL